MYVSSQPTPSDPLQEVIDLSPTWVILVYNCYYMRGRSSVVSVFVITTLGC